MKSFCMSHSKMTYCKIRGFVCLFLEAVLTHHFGFANAVPWKEKSLVFLNPLEAKKSILQVASTERGTALIKGISAIFHK